MLTVKWWNPTKGILENPSFPSLPLPFSPPCFCLNPPHFHHWSVCAWHDACMMPNKYFLLQCCSSFLRQDILFATREQLFVFLLSTVSRSSHHPLLISSNYKCLAIFFVRKISPDQSGINKKERNGHVKEHQRQPEVALRITPKISLLSLWEPPPKGAQYLLYQQIIIYLLMHWNNIFYWYIRFTYGITLYVYGLPAWREKLTSH